MAGIAKPNINGLREEGSIAINSFSNVYQSYNPSIYLFNGITTSENGSYGSILSSGTTKLTIEFTLAQKSNIWAIGTPYIDSAGSTGKSVILYKYDESKSVYNNVGTYETYNNSTWYKFLPNLTKGKYKIEGQGSYVSFNEWYVEGFQHKLILKNPTTNQNYSLADKTLIHLPSLTNENMILHGVEQGKEILLDEPFDKIKLIKDTSEVLGEAKIFTHVINVSELKVKEILL